MPTYVQTYCEKIEFGKPVRDCLHTVEVQRKGWKKGSRVLFVSRWHAIREDSYGPHIVYDGLRFQITTTEEN